MPATSRSLFALLVVSALAVVTGCSPSTTRRQITVQLAEDTKVNNFEVRVVGVPAAYQQDWDKLDVEDAFFSPQGAAVAPQLTWTRNFEEGGPRSFTLERGDPIWKSWGERDVASVYVLAGLRGVTYRNNAYDDRRRLKIPVWETTGKPVVVEIGDRGLKQK